MPLLMIINIKVFNKITHIPRNNQQNIVKIIHMVKKEIKLIYSIFLEDKIDSLKQKLYNSLESAEQIELLI